MDNEKRIRLLQFVTGTCRLPVGGFAELIGVSPLALLVPWGWCEGSSRVSRIYSLLGSKSVRLSPALWVGPGSCLWRVGGSSCA